MCVFFFLFILFKWKFENKYADVPLKVSVTQLCGTRFMLMIRIDTCVNFMEVVLPSVDPASVPLLSIRTVSMTWPSALSSIHISYIAI